MSWSSRPRPAFASTVRALLNESHEPLLEPDEVHRIAMAGYEMIDNLIKYSLGGAGHFEVELFRGDAHVYTRLCSTNPAKPEDRRAVRQLVSRLQSARSPTAVYDELVASSPARVGSGLGLARIHVECEMSLDCVADGDRMTLVAGRRVAARGGL
jgi:hypothetical protein